MIGGAAFPIMLVNDTENHAHQGLATFLYRSGEVTGVRFQFIQQTTPYLIPQHFVAWGLAAANLDPAAQGDLARLRAAAACRARRSDAVTSLERIAQERASRHLYGFGAPLAPKWVVITAIVRNGTLYYSDSATPYGPYPYPLEMRFGPRSILKDVRRAAGAAAAGRSVRPLRAQPENRRLRAGGRSQISPRPLHRCGRHGHGHGRGRQPEDRIPTTPKTATSIRTTTRGISPGPRRTRCAKSTHTMRPIRGNPAP